MDVYWCFIEMKAYKICENQREIKRAKRENEQTGIQHRRVLKGVGPNGSVIRTI